MCAGAGATVVAFLVTAQILSCSDRSGSDTEKPSGPEQEGSPDIRVSCTVSDEGHGSCVFTNKGSGQGTLCGAVHLTEGPNVKLLVADLLESLGLAGTDLNASMALLEETQKKKRDAEARVDEALAEARREKIEIGNVNEHIRETQRSIDRIRRTGRQEGLSPDMIG